MTQSRRLIIVSQHFAPSTGATAQLISDLADELNHLGTNVVVVTSTIPCSSSTHRYPVIRTHYLQGRTSNSIIFKSFSGIYYSLFILLWSLFNLKPHRDHLLLVSNPPFIGLIGVLLNKTKGLSYSFLHQDLFPRSAVVSGIIPAKGPLNSILNSLLRSVDASSTYSIFLSSSMRTRHTQNFHTSNAVTIHNWAVEKALPIPKNECKLASQLGLADSITVQYSGNFGRMHDMLTLLESIRLLSRDRFSFLFIGGGAKEQQIIKYRDAFNLQNLHLLPYQPRHLLPQSLASCDISALTLTPGAEDTVAPSKLYGILASGKPVLLVARSESEISHLILDHQCGIVVEPGDICSLVDQLNHLSNSPETLLSMGHNSHAAYQYHFGRKKSVQKYYSLFK